MLNTVRRETQNADDVLRIHRGQGIYGNMLYTVRMKITDNIVGMDCEQREQGFMGLYLV